MELPTQKDKKGLGYVPGKAPLATPAHPNIPPPIQFVKGGIQFEDVDAIGDETDSECYMDQWIRPTTPRQEPANWFSEDIAVISRLQE